MKNYATRAREQVSQIKNQFLHYSTSSDSAVASIQEIN
jgi:hypothetical protein